MRVGGGCQQSGQREKADFILKEVEPASVLGRDSAPMGEGRWTEKAVNSVCGTVCLTPLAPCLAAANTRAVALGTTQTAFS